MTLPSSERVQPASDRVRVLREGRAPDLESAEAAAGQFLPALGVRGVRSAGSTTVPSTLLGTLREDPGSRAEFLALTGQPAGRARS